MIQSSEAMTVMKLISTNLSSIMLFDNNGNKIRSNQYPMQVSTAHKGNRHKSTQSRVMVRSEIELGSVSASEVESELKSE